MTGLPTPSPAQDAPRNESVAPATRSKPWPLRMLRSRWFQAYLALLALSHLVIALQGPVNPARVKIPRGASRLNLTLALPDASGASGGSPYRLAVLNWSPRGGRAEDAAARARRVPVILLHGSPSGGGMDFSQLAPELAAAGYTVLAPDLPGFGASVAGVPDYSIRANARLALAVMDDLQIPRAHIVGWSRGGGSALWMAELAPERIASLTLMASIGGQETEGSGDYFFEHAKYRLGQAFIVGLPELVPHFGLAGRRETRRALIRNLIDSDQRPLHDVMQRLTTPTLLLHGRRDFLIPAWTADEHHKLIGPSTLVMLDGNHFLPLTPPLGDEGQLEIVVEHVLTHLALHDNPGAPALRGEARFARSQEAKARRLGGIQLSHSTPWWVVIIAIVMGTFISEDLTIITVGLLMVNQSLDWGVGLIGCFIAIVIGDLTLWGMGRFLGRRVLRWPLIRNVVNDESVERWGRVLDNHTGKAVLLSRCLPGTRMPTFIAAGILSQKAHHFAMWVALAAFIWTPFLLGMTMLVGPRVLEVFQTVFHGPWAVGAAVVALYIVIRLVGYETTPQGRDRLKADLKRYVSREFWPRWVRYLPLVPYYLWLSIRHRGVLTWACANPGIPNGGGIVGESKTRILDGFRDVSGLVLSARLISEGAPQERTAQAVELIRDGAVGGYPVVFKPDSGERGAGMKVVRSDDDVASYFQTTNRAVQIQRYHPGPYELGVLWARRPTPGVPVDEWPGEIISVTSKVFPVIEGDGKRTLESLLWRHPRYRMQARVFLKRFAGQADRVLHTGERLQLSLAGNHSQGALLEDGSGRMTAALARRLDELAQDWRDPGTGMRIDFGQFDIRFADEREAQEGRGFAVVEFDGTPGESAAMYDPARSMFWGYAMLFRHWSRLFRIGAARRGEGVKPISLRALLAAFGAHRRHGAPPRVSD